MMADTVLAATLVLGYAAVLFAFSTWLLRHSG
jgi:hypothetical protein